MQRGDAFAGDRKTGRWLLAELEQKLVRRLLPRVPRFLETHHLTLLTLPWCAGVVLCGWLATRDPAWLWGTSGFIALQYLTDLLDGAVGRQRETGLVRWGFHMDHLLDFVFLCAIWSGYVWLLPPGWTPLLLLLVALSGALMVNGFLDFAATNEFRISHGGIGPTEIRLGFVGLNTAVIALGPGILPPVLLLLAGGTAVALVAIVHGTQRRLWSRDMASRDAGRTAAAAAGR
jgi:phosphatidylglycerophosphate synthase